MVKEVFEVYFVIYHQVSKHAKRNQISNFNSFMWEALILHVSGQLVFHNLDYFLINTRVVNTHEKVPQRVSTHNFVSWRTDNYILMVLLRPIVYSLDFKLLYDQ